MVIQSLPMFNLKQMLAATSQGSHKRIVEAASTGLFVAAAAECGRTLPGTLGGYLTRIRRAIELDQITFYFDLFGRYVGHVWWTQVSIDREASLLGQGPDGLDASDFSLQGDAWIIDFHAQHGALPDILLDIRDSVLPHCETVTYWRIKKSRRIAKRTSRDSKASFFRSPPKAMETSRSALLDDRDLSFTASSKMEKFIHLGMALMVLGQHSTFAQMPLSVMFRRICHPLAFKQYRLHVSAHYEPMGFFTWAWLDVEERTRFGFRSLHALDDYEWSEGESLFLCDAVAAPDGLGDVLNDLAGEWHVGETLYFYPSVDDGVSASTITPFSLSDRPGLRQAPADLRDGGVDVVGQLALREKGAC
jgi:hemolysin-activating ACP:hemolysin acyltransferase